MFYKFRPINKWLIDSLVKSSLYIPHISELNDPFDCQLDISSLLERVADSAKGQDLEFIRKYIENPGFIINWKNVMNKIGVYSFSIPDPNEKILSEPLMWSHYADKHAGVCIKYNVTNDVFDEYIKSDSDFMATGIVSYDSEKIIEEIRSLPLTIDDFTVGLISKFLLTKSKSWVYENEARFVFRRSKTIVLPKNIIEKIYFGLTCPAPDIDLVIKLSKEYSDCREFYRAERAPGYHEIKFRKIDSADDL